MREGDPVTPIRLPAIDGSRFDSDALRGRRYLINFFRFATCPFCNMRMAELVRRRAELGADFEVVAVFEAEPGHLRRHAGRHQAPFPVLADPGRVSYRDYGIGRSVLGVLKGIGLRAPVAVTGMLRGYLPREVSARWFTMPASFLVDEQGRIRRAYYGRDEGDHLPFDEVKSFALEGQGPDRAAAASA